MNDLVMKNVFSKEINFFDLDFGTFGQPASVNENYLSHHMMRC